MSHRYLPYHLCNKICNKKKKKDKDSCCPTVNNYLIYKNKDNKCCNTCPSLLSYVVALNSNVVTIDLPSETNTPLFFLENAEGLGNRYQTSPTPNSNYGMVAVNTIPGFGTAPGYTLLINTPGDYEFHYSFVTRPEGNLGIDFSTNGYVSLHAGNTNSGILPVPVSYTEPLINGVVQPESNSIPISTTVTGFGKITAPSGTTPMLPYYTVLVVNISLPETIALRISSLRMSFFRLNNINPI